MAKLPPVDYTCLLSVSSAFLHYCPPLNKPCITILRSSCSFRPLFPCGGSHKDTNKDAFLLLHSLCQFNSQIQPGTPREARKTFSFCIQVNEQMCQDSPAQLSGQFQQVREREPPSAKVPLACLLSALHSFTHGWNHGRYGTCLQKPRVPSHQMDHEILAGPGCDLM